LSTPTTNIEWTDATWNPVRGCRRISPGCKNCYAEKIAARFSGKGLAYEGLAKMTKAGARWTGKVRFVPESLEQPLRWREPRRIFVNSMSDLFHEDLTDEEIATIFAVCVAAHHLRGHTFQILTKRAERMARTLKSQGFWAQVNAEAWEYVAEGTDPDNRRHDDARATIDDYGPENPPPGLWGGVSVEDQERAEERIRWLLESPFVVRFLSCEPLLGPLDLDRPRCDTHDRDFVGTCEELGEYCTECAADGWSGEMSYGHWLGDAEDGIGWVIVGGESGHEARPCAIEWITSIMEQCRERGVPCFVKQMGAVVVSEGRTAPADMMGRPGELKPEHCAPNGEVWAWRAGLTDKKGADPEQFRELRTREFPEVRHG
jgi:protein gp37